MICHVVIVAESADQVLLSGGATDLHEHFLGSWCPYDRHIQSTMLIVKWVNQFISIWIFKLGHFGLPFVRFQSWPRRALVAWRLMWSTQSCWDWIVFSCEPQSIIIILRVYVDIDFDRFGCSWVDYVLGCQLVKYDIPTPSYLPGRGVETLIPLLFERVLHFSDFGSSFCHLSLGTRTNVIEQNILTWDRFSFFSQNSVLVGVTSCTSDVVHWFIR